MFRMVCCTDSGRSFGIQCTMCARHDNNTKYSTGLVVLGMVMQWSKMANLGEKMCFVVGCNVHSTLYMQCSLVLDRAAQKIFICMSARPGRPWVCHLCTKCVQVIRCCCCHMTRLQGCSLFPRQPACKTYAVLSCGAKRLVRLVMCPFFHKKGALFFLFHNISHCI